MRKYDEEFKQQALKKFFDGQSVASVARELGISEGLLHNWKKGRVEVSTDLERENLELKKRLREVEMERDILKKGGSYLRQGRVKRYEFIHQERSSFPLRLLCRVMRVSRSAYNAWAAGKTYRQSERRIKLTAQVRACFYRHRRRYGTRRIKAELAAADVKVGR